MSRLITTNLYAFVSVLMFLGTLQAQTDPLYEDWRWVQFTENSGLPSNDILDVFETTTGIVWVRTDAGLAWYDGFVWQPVGPAEGLPLGIISQAKPGLNGDVLVVAEEKYYHGTTHGFQFVPVVVDGDSVSVSQVLPRNEDQVYVFSDQALFMVQNGESFELGALPKASLSTQKRQVVRTRSGRIWSLSSVGLHEWGETAWIPQVLGHGFADIVEDVSGELIFSEHSAVQQGLWIWPTDGTPKYKEQEATGLIVTAMHMAANGDVVVVYASGLVEVRRGEVWTKLVPVPQWMRGAKCLYFSENQDLWVGSDEGVFLFRSSSKRWTQLGGNNLRPKEMVVGEIHQMDNGDLWAGTLAGVSIYHPNGTVTHIDSVLGNSIASVTGIAEDRDGGVWITSGGGFQGAYRWHHNTWRYYGQDDGLLASHYHRIIPDRQGRLWFLGLADVISGAGLDQEQGAFVYDGQGLAQWGPNKGLIHGRVYAFSEASDGALWFGTLGGLSRWFDGKWKHWTSKDGLKSDRIFTLVLDNTDRVWFGHGANKENGLGYIDEQGLPQYFTVADGLVGNRVFEISMAPDGALWLGVWGSGINRYQDGIFSAFGRDTGLDNLNLWPVLPLSQEVYVGTSAGMYVLDLSERENPPPRVELSAPVIDGNRVVLRWQAHPFWGAMPMDKVETRYKLDNSDWSAWSTEREIVHNDLVSGEHNFVVQSKGFMGNMEEMGNMVSFHVAPPFYWHPLFWGGVCFWGVSLVVIGVGYWRKQRRFLHEIEHRNTELETEISERSAIEEKLRQSEEKFRQLVEFVPYGIVLVAKDGQINLINAQTESLFGYRRDELLGQNIELLMPERFRETHRGHIGLYYNDLTQRPMGSDLSLWGRRRNGSEFPVEISLGPVTIENEVLVLGIIVDVTDRERLQEQLRQSQKMEAIGNLAGGIAHDFNNLLTVINGYSQMLSLQTDAGPTRNLLDEITNAGERASALTRQLLAFSRKQVLQPKLLDLNAVLTDTAKMLRRLIGEDIEFSVVYGAKGHIKADPSQLEQVFLNLVVNARDAMPQGGTLMIKTENKKVGSRFFKQNEELPIGDYVVISVRDTGVGMSAETQSQIFEPFFTTKEVGKGTGLGLAMVYGIVKQSGGYIFVDSEVGKGTTFNIYFNRVEEVVDEGAEAQVPEISYGGTETVLLVEDDDMVRDFTCQVLTQNGYRVLDAESGERAFELCHESGSDIALLLTDVVMPNLSGRQVAEQLQETYPNLKVLFMSGYTDDAIFQHGIIDEEVAFIQKPFKPNEVLKKVREILDS